MNLHQRPQQLSSRKDGSGDGFEHRWSLETASFPLPTAARMQAVVDGKDSYEVDEGIQAAMALRAPGAPIAVSPFYPDSVTAPSSMQMQIEYRTTGEEVSVPYHPSYRRP